MIFAAGAPDLTPLRQRICEDYRIDEANLVERLLERAELPPTVEATVVARAAALIEKVRAERLNEGGMDAFMAEYELTSDEGIVLMCLAEALLRIPDADTADKLIKDKIGGAQWESHLGQSHSWFVNASTWALMLTGRVLRWEDRREHNLGAILGRLVAKTGEPVIRTALMQAMRILGRQFVMGRTVEEALERAVAAEEQGYRHSYDMLGEAARTAEDARGYMEAYDAAIAALGTAADGRSLEAAPGISVKLSALDPRYEFAQRDRAIANVTPRLTALALHAREVGIGLTVDAEEADRLDLSLDIFERVRRDPALKGWDGLGLAVQAYQKRALPVLDWLDDLARDTGTRLMVRLVKGAYWDAEIKHAQERGHDGYPVFTRKPSTDVSYIACVQHLLERPASFFAQFATHNAHTIATVLTLAAGREDYEFQKLHGMGEALYDEVVGRSGSPVACRVYAPVGSHEELLPYLVRRLLENGANTSFVNRIVDESLPVAELAQGPVARLRTVDAFPHPSIPLPANIYQPERPNAAGIDLSDPLSVERLGAAMAVAAQDLRRAAPVISGEVTGRADAVSRVSPADGTLEIGQVVEAGPPEADMAVSAAVAAFPVWAGLPPDERAAILRRAGDLLEEHTPALMAICSREGGKTLPDGLAEVREAVDFCRYYAAQLAGDFGRVETLPGPTGELNQLSRAGRGVIAAISPWNFPVAIFTGQVVGALAAGNCVIAKPAEQTPLAAARVVELFHQAGVPSEVLHYLPGRGDLVGAALTADPRVAGVVFTGSTETARLINQTLAGRPGPIVPFIAETGGQNAMIVDSSALTEQVVGDVVQSAFNSAGQRCSACRVLFVQDDVAERTLTMLDGAMAELTIGAPWLLSTDVGPVVDAEALAMLEAHAARMTEHGRLVAACRLPDGLPPGFWFAPRAFEIDRLAILEREVFGPILHVIRFDGGRLDQVIDAINDTGYGLTLGVHSRIESTIGHIRSRVRVGNMYVNRNMIGAVVGSQPFGGQGLSGTGPKAGGPGYLHRLATERSYAEDITASGGNASLMTLAES